MKPLPQNPNEIAVLDELRLQPLQLETADGRPQIVVALSFTTRLGPDEPVIENPPLLIRLDLAGRIGEQLAAWARDPASIPRTQAQTLH